MATPRDSASVHNPYGPPPKIKGSISLIAHLNLNKTRVQAFGQPDLPLK